MRKARVWKLALLGGVALLIVLGSIQLVPYGRDHENPPVVMEPLWESQQTRSLAVRACFDCHSNETKWPWYANIAPMSWLIQNHVDKGRSALNFSEWDRQQDKAGEVTESVQEDEMPPRSYRWLNSKARLSSAELDILTRGLEATFGREEGQGAERKDKDDD